MKPTTILAALAAALLAGTSDAGAADGPTDGSATEPQASPQTR